MAKTTIPGGYIEAGSIDTASLADTSITADKLHTTLDLTGKTITVATATAGDNDTTVASTAFVSTAIANLAPLASPDFTGDATFDTSTLVIDSTNNRVGIGTSSPDQLLQVGSESYGANAIIKTQVDGSDVGNFDSGLHMRSHDDNFGGSIILESRSGTNDIVNFKYHNNSSAGATAMAIDATNGNVGIGTPSPLGNLQIITATAGTVLNVNHNNGGSYPKASGIGLGGTTTAYTVDSDGGTVSFTGGAGIYAENTADSGNPTNLVFWTNLAGTPEEAMRISSGGNVGIGTSSPTALSGYATLALNGTNGGLLEFKKGDTQMSYIANAGNPQLQFVTNGQERMLITNTGKIGIGTDATNLSTLSVGPTTAHAQNRIAIFTDDYNYGCMRIGSSTAEASLGFMRSTTEANTHASSPSGGNNTWGMGLGVWGANFGFGSNSLQTYCVEWDSSGHMLPGANNTYDLGSTAKGW